MNSRVSVTITTLGSSDAFNSGGRGNSCFWVQDAVGSYLLDCGPSALRSMQALELPINELDALYLTHLHGDHIGGIPGLLLTLHYHCERRRPFVIAGPVGTRERITALCQLCYPSTIPDALNFELSFIEWARHSESSAAGRRVSARPAQHDEQVAPSSLLIAPLEGEGAKVAFSGDTGWCDGLVELASRADALVCECSYLEPVFGGHLSLDELKNNRQKLEVDRLILTHLGDEARAAAIKVAPEMRAEVADDGSRYELLPASSIKLKV